MSPAPKIVGGARVIAYTFIDERHRATRSTKHFVAGEPAGLVAGLAICKHEEDAAFFLFGCDEKWNSVADTWHTSVEEAISQAEFEYAGSLHTWIYPETENEV